MLGSSETTPYTALRGTQRTYICNCTQILRNWQRSHQQMLNFLPFQGCQSIFCVQCLPVQGTSPGVSSSAHGGAVMNAVDIYEICNKKIIQTNNMHFQSKTTNTPNSKNLSLSLLTCLPACQTPPLLITPSDSSLLKSSTFFLSECFAWCTPSAPNDFLPAPHICQNLSHP